MSRVQLAYIPGPLAEYVLLGMMEDLVTESSGPDEKSSAVKYSIKPFTDSFDRYEENYDVINMNVEKFVTKLYAEHGEKAFIQFALYAMVTVCNEDTMNQMDRVITACKVDHRPNGAHRLAQVFHITDYDATGFEPNVEAAGYVLSDGIRDQAITIIRSAVLFWCWMFKLMGYLHIPASGIEVRKALDNVRLLATAPKPDEHAEKRAEEERQYRATAAANTRYLLELLDELAVIPEDGKPRGNPGITDPTEIIDPVVEGPLQGVKMRNRLERIAISVSHHHGLSTPPFDDSVFDDYGVVEGIADHLSDIKEAHGDKALAQFLDYAANTVLDPNVYNTLADLAHSPDEHPPTEWTSKKKSKLQNFILRLYGLAHHVASERKMLGMSGRLNDMDHKSELMVLVVVFWAAVYAKYEGGGKGTFMKLLLKLPKKEQDIIDNEEWLADQKAKGSIATFAQLTKATEEEHQQKAVATSNTRHLLDLLDELAVLPEDGANK